MSVHNVERSRTSNVSGSWRRLTRRYGPRLASLECISRHRGRCADKWPEHVRAGNSSVQRRGSKSRSSLQRAEIISYVTHWPRGHELSLDILAWGQRGQRACAYVGRRSGLLDVADRRTVTSR